MLVCLGFIHTLEIIARILSEVVNRERLCGTNALYMISHPMSPAKPHDTPLLPIRWLDRKKLKIKPRQEKKKKKKARKEKTMVNDCKRKEK